MEDNIKQKQENPKIIIQKESKYNKVIPISEWVGITILLAIPLVNIVAIIVWASSSNVNPNIKNYALAILIIWGIFIGLFFLLGLSFAGIFSGLLN